MWIAGPLVEKKENNDEESKAIQLKLANKEGLQ